MNDAAASQRESAAGNDTRIYMHNTTTVMSARVLSIERFSSSDRYRADSRCVDTPSRIGTR
ncbi:hypothetical protein Plhal304r1_c021g0074381 [Plasmopara halstedii]